MELSAVSEGCDRYFDSLGELQDDPSELAEQSQGAGEVLSQKLFRTNV
jgi:hypothetical protein